MTTIVPIDIRQEVSRCLLCYDAPCSKACPASNKPDRFLRALYFQNLKGAYKAMISANPFSEICALDCQGKALCQKACTRRKIDAPIDIPKIKLFLAQCVLADEIKTTLPETETKKKVILFGNNLAITATAAFLAHEGVDTTIYYKKDAAWEEKHQGQQILDDANVKTEWITEDMKFSTCPMEADAYIGIVEDDDQNCQQHVFSAEELLKDTFAVVAIRNGRKTAKKVLAYLKEGG